ncbi:PAS domain S-box protein [Mucilaginibacter flavidus]|uniref:PAS domain S-box protein n=1 Tax=Mucilaginibacter flavidus TaxID=2949309 RepID=UPI002092D824|nr:PAS domain S-box protein [Mucilaginibacter flavidus]MCO5949971.1 PAS domain S-box protein [Mucilaginibacter flavidus]
MEGKFSGEQLLKINNLGLLVADHIHAMLAYWDKDEICRFANNAYLEWFNKRREDMVDKITMKELLGQLYEKNLPYINGVLNGNAQEFERQITIPNGEIRHTIASYYPDIIDGEVKGFFVHVADITKIKNLENKLILSQNKFKSLLESAPDSLVIVNGSGEIQIINEQTQIVFGYTKDELYGQKIEMLLPDRFKDHHPGQRASFFAKAYARRMGAGHELFGKHKKGYEFPVEISISPIQLEDGLYVSAAIRDVTEQKTRAAELKESNDRNKIFIQQAPNAIAMFDKEMRYLAASKKWITDYKLTGKEIIGQSHYEIFPEIDDDWKAIHQACLNGAINQCDEASFTRKDGSIQWITWDVRPWFVSENNIGGILMYTADISGIKEKDQEKRRIEEILDKTNEVARIGTWEVDLVNSTVKWSRITKEIHEVDPGYEPDLSTAINFFKEGPSRETIQSAVACAIKYGTGYDIEVELVTARGNNIWARAIGQSEFKNGVCTRLYGIFQDIDEVKRAKETLNTLNEELNTLLNAGYVSIVGTDTKGLITHFNRGAELLLQYSATEMVGIKTPAQIHLEEEVTARGHELSALYGKTIAGFDIFTELPKHGEYESREWTYVRKDGSTFPVQLVVTAIKNQQGGITGFLGVATDISELKKAENEMRSLLEITTDQNNRLKNFAHIVSHNLRSHTGNIDMCLDLYIEENDGVSENEYIKLLKQSINNLKETIANLNEVVLMNTSFSEKLVPINLFNAIESAANNVSQLARDAMVTIKNKADPQLEILAIPAYLDSVLLNFITNGIKYRSPDREANVTFTTIIKNDFVVLQIKDNGLGIDLKRHSGKLFGMYKTFHGNKDARGIGLFITKNQIEALGGKVEVESEIGKGTKFKIYFKHEEN